MVKDRLQNSSMVEYWYQGKRMKSTLKNKGKKIIQKTLCKQSNQIFSLVFVRLTKYCKIIQ